MAHLTTHAVPTSHGKTSLAARASGFCIPPPTSLPNGFEDLEDETSPESRTSLESKTPSFCENRDDHRSQNPPRNHRRDFGTPRYRFRRQVPPIMHPRIQIVGSVMPTTPILHNPLHLCVYPQMAQGVPGAGGESRLPRQAPTLLGPRA